MENIGTGWLADRLPPFLREALAGVSLDAAREVRLRLGQPIEVRYASGGRLLKERASEGQLRELIGALTGHSVYACERQMREGFFTLPDGCRVGLTGRYAEGEDGPVQAVTSVCIRIARQIDGAADGLMSELIDEGRARSALILSAPCMGKTTLLRDAIRQLTSRGFCVAVADERGELSGALGPRADVAEGCPKRLAIARLVRAMAPDIVATDELGHPGDAEAVMEAARSGVAVLATAHAPDLERARGRRTLRLLLDEEVFERIIELGGEAGHVRRIRDGRGEALWTDGRSD